MVEHLAKVVAIDPSTARRTSIKMFLFGQIAHAMDHVPPAPKLNDRASHVARLVPLRLRLLLLLLHGSFLLNIGQPQPSLNHVGQGTPCVPVPKCARHF
jgi:hypothetical protein